MSVYLLNGLESKSDAGAEPPISLVEKLATLPLLESVEPRLLGAIAQEFEWFSLPGGQLLFSEGDTGDSLYVVLSGRLGAFQLSDDGKEVLRSEERRVGKECVP